MATRLKDDILVRTLRIPSALLDEIKTAAIINGKSVNAEIVSRLSDSFERERDHQIAANLGFKLRRVSSCPIAQVLEEAAAMLRKQATTSARAA